MSTTLKIPVFSGEKFRRARLRAGVSLRDPRWPFKSASTKVPNYQAGRKRPTFETAHKFAEILGCSISELYDYIEVGGDDE